MGTNYYMASKFCEHCGRADRDLHIGKSSGGWTFSFRGYRNDWEQPKIESYEQWLAVLVDALIVDEYGKLVPLDDFKQMVEVKRNQLFNHTVYVNREHPEHAKNCWLDGDGHSFTGIEFS